MSKDQVNLLVGTLLFVQGLGLAVSCLVGLVVNGAADDTILRVLGAAGTIWFIMGLFFLRESRVVDQAEEVKGSIKDS